MKFTFAEIQNSLEYLGLLELLNLEKALYHELGKRANKLNSERLADKP